MPSLTTATLTIAGVVIDRKATNCVINQLRIVGKGGYSSLHFARVGITPAAPPDPWDSQLVTLTQGTTLVFSGSTGMHLDHYQEGLGWVREWTCFDLRKLADYVPVTDDNTSTDTARYNQAGDDPSAIPSREGRTIGQMVADLLQQPVNAAGLAGYGVGNYTGSTLPASTLADLAALTVIPPFEIDFIGERILPAIEGAVQTCHPNHFVYVEPAGDIRVRDPRTFTPVTLTLNSASDPRVGMPTVSMDYSECYTRLLVRGGSLVVGQYFDLVVGTLSKDYSHDGLSTAQSEAAWKPTDYLYPLQPAGQATATPTVSSGTVSALTLGLPGYGYDDSLTYEVLISGGGGSGASYTAHSTGGRVSGFTQVSAGSGYTGIPTVTVQPPGVGQSDLGTCTCTDTLHISVTSSNPLVTWPAGYWDYSPTGHQGQVFVYTNTLSGFTQQFSARVIANTALARGGSCTFTLDVELPSLAYTTYNVFGTAGGASFVFRRYAVTDAATGAAIAQAFPYPFAVRNADGTAATKTSMPCGFVSYSASGNPPFEQRSIGITVDPTTGTILTNYPTNLVWSPDKQTSVPVDNVTAFLPINTGALEVAYPPDTAGPTQNFAGTAFSVLGIQRTKVISVNEWRDASNSGNMATYAQEQHGCVSNIVYEGSCPYFGLNAAFLAIGASLNIAGSGYTTGYEAMAAPVMGVTIDYHETSDGATTHTMMLEFSGRRQPYSGASLLRPNVTGQSFGFGQGHDLFSGGPASGLGSIGGGLHGEAASAVGGMQGSIGQAVGGMNAAAMGGGDTGQGDDGAPDFSSFEGGSNNLRKRANSPEGRAAEAKAARRRSAREAGALANPGGNVPLAPWAVDDGKPKPVDPAERDRIANLGKHPAPRDDRIGKAAPKADDPEERERIANLGKHPAPNDPDAYRSLGQHPASLDRYRGLGERKVEPAEQARIANLGRRRPAQDPPDHDGG